MAAQSASIKSSDSKASFIPGRPGSPEYRAIHAAIDRCHNPNSRVFVRYGARGITVCDRWRFGDGRLTGAQCFFADIGPRPSAAHSIDRIDNDGNYEPGNCRWATAKIQANNRRPANRPPGLSYNRGQAHPSAKLTEQQAKEVITMNARGVPSKAIAATFKISRTTVWNIVTGARWPHLRRP